MKKKIAILGSTGSIGRQTLDIIRKNKKNFKIMLLTANKNHNLLSKQIVEFKVKNIIVTNNKSYLFLKKKFKKINVFNNLEKIDNIIKSKLDYTMSSISGFDGLKPTIKIIKKTKTIAIANKESIICGWRLIKKQLDKHKTKFIPVDSEHFSIWSVIKDVDTKIIDKIIITASGGPFLNLKSQNIKKTPKLATNHPNWKMGKKISTDSATLMNKVFEVIEAQRIFKIDINKFDILIHPSSYIHSIIKLNNGQIKILAHDTDMKIPIFNSIYQENFKKINTKKVNINLLNNLNLIKINLYKYPSIKILKKINNINSLFETVLISANDELVELYIHNKIKFLQINKILLKILNNKKYSNLIKKKPKKISDITNLSEEVRLKTRNLCIQ